MFAYTFSMMLFLPHMTTCTSNCYLHWTLILAGNILLSSNIIVGWMLEKKPVSSHVHGQAEFGLMQMRMVNQNNCLGVVVMLYATFKQFRGLNLNRSRPQLSK